MVLKRQFGEDASDHSSLNNSSQSPPSKTRKVANYVLKEVSLQDIATQISAILEPALRRMVKEEVEPLIYFLQSSPRRSLGIQQDSLPLRSLQLLFVNKLPSTVFTNSKVEDEGHDPLEIKLVDAKSKSLIQHGPFYSIKVEIFALNGDFAADGRENWSESEFNDNILREREGKRPLLVGDTSLSLIGGLGTIGNITFTDNSSWVRSRKFKLGVRVMSRSSHGIGIKEAVSEAFVVLDHRGESYQKHNTPSLDDPVWRLKKISKQGASHKKLEKNGIKTVKDFLMQYNMNSSFLRTVLGKGVANRTWDIMVKHANECQMNNTYYSYFNESESAQLLFNCVYKVEAVKFEGQDYQPVNTLDTCQKVLVEKLKQFAFMNLNQLIPVNNPSDNSTSMEPTVEQHVLFPPTQKLDLHHDAVSFIDQGNTSTSSISLLRDKDLCNDFGLALNSIQDEPGKKLDINLSDSASYPCTIEDLFEVNSASQTNQPTQGFAPGTFLMDDYSAALSDKAYNWHQNSSMTTFAQTCQFGEFSHIQTSPFYPVASNWGQEDNIFATSTPTHLGILSHVPDFTGVMSGTGKSRAGWCKIRAAVMWKIVRRNAAAKRKAKFPFGYH